MKISEAKKKIGCEVMVKVDNLVHGPYRLLSVTKLGKVKLKGLEEQMSPNFVVDYDKEVMESENVISEFVQGVDYEGYKREGLEDYLQVIYLGFCGCGLPKENLEYVRRGLTHITKEAMKGASHSEQFANWKKEGREIFVIESSRRFFFYWADKEGLAEHGVGLPGWLTEKGENLLRVLQAITLLTKRRKTQSQPSFYQELS